MKRVSFLLSSGRKYLMKRENSRAEISVFFALITAMILALFLGILESARTEAARLNMTIAANSSIDSLFSQYHLGLWTNYRLMGLEHYAPDQLIEEMEGFLEPYLEVKNWAPAELEEIFLEDVIVLTEEDGEYFEEDVMDYMKYGIVAEIWDELVGEFWSEDKIDEYDKGVPEGDALEDISDLYDDHAIETANIEKIIGKISDAVNSVNVEVSEARAFLGSDPPDGSSFISGLEDAISEMEKISGLVDEYSSAAGDLEKALDESRKKLDEKKAELAGQNKEISEDVWAGLESDIEKYGEYVDENGKKRQEIEALKPESLEKIEFLKARIEQAEQIMEEIEEAREAWESQQDSESESDPPTATGEEEFDESAFWAPLISEMAAYTPLKFNYTSGIADEEKEGKLESLKELFSGPDLLDLVLPEKPELSKDTLPDLDEMPSQTAEGLNKVDRLGLLDKVRMAWYVGSFFNYFGRGVNDEEEAKGSGSCEQEYILYGHDNDRENVASVVTTLIALRSGLNLIYLYRDSAKRNQAYGAAQLIAPVPPLTIVVQFLVMTVWAAAQAVMDVRDLLAGKKVPFIHDNESFYLDVDGIWRIADKGGDVGDEKNEGESEKGLSYQDYLKILIFIGQNSSMDYRIMDMIQLGLRESKDKDGKEGKYAQKDFRMDRLAYSIEATVNLNMSHMFSELGFVKAFGGVDRNYYLSIPTAYSY